MSKKKRLANNKMPKAAQKEDKSQYTYQEDKLSQELIIRERKDLTEKQKLLIELILDKKTKLVFIKGPAGTAKSFTSIYSGLLLLNKKNISSISYIRSVVESASRSLGFLPGDSSTKMEPFLQVLVDKLAELLQKPDIDRLTKEKRIEGLPVNYLRGASISAKLMIADEAQNFTFSELTTIITRIGNHTKCIICGDETQSDIGDKSGFLKMFDLFNDDSCRENGIFTFTFNKEDIVRSGVLRFIIERLEMDKNRKVVNEPMFLNK